MINLSTPPILTSDTAEGMSEELRSYLYSTISDLQNQLNMQLEELSTQIAALQSAVNNS